MPSLVCTPSDAALRPRPGPGWRGTALALGGLLLACSPAFALSAGELTNVKPLGHHFTTALSNGTRLSSTKNPTAARILVLKLSLTVPEDGARIFVDDFSLQYRHNDGKEDRARAFAVCKAKTADLGEDAGCGMGEGAAAVLGRSDRYLILAFFVEHDVGTVALARPGAAPVSYELGAQRRYSVFMSTNRGADTLAKPAQLVQAGGYQVTRTSTGLNADHSGVTIHYAKQAETAAREISQRFMTGLGVAPTVKESELASDHDVVIWFGKP
jgi:hypothetical protein